MQREPANAPTADWARQNLLQPVPIRLRHGSIARTLISLLLFAVPLLIIAALSLLKLSGSARQTSWWGILLFGAVLAIPAVAILLRAQKGS